MSRIKGADQCQEAVRKISELASRISEINSLVFQKMRKAFRIPDYGNLSENIE